MNYTTYKYKIGYLKFGYQKDTLLSIEYLKESNDLGDETEFSKEIDKQFKEYFSGSRKSFNIKYKLIGTPFQISVWEELAKIPYGETRTYKDIAKNVGNDKASRAVGMANNKNNLLLIIPCHRVVGSNKKLVGFAIGLDVKEYLLKLEKEHIND